IPESWCGTYNTNSSTRTLKLSSNSLAPSLTFEAGSPFLTSIYIALRSSVLIYTSTPNYGFLSPLDTNRVLLSCHCPGLQWAGRVLLPQVLKCIPDRISQFSLCGSTASGKSGLHNNRATCIRCPLFAGPNPFEYWW